MTEKKSGIVVVGSMNMDLSVNTAEFPKAGETVFGSSILQSPGGKGANQAVAAALVGGQVSLIAMRGDDAYGELLAQLAEKAGVDVSLIHSSREEKTGTAVITVDSRGENTIVISPGANSLMAPEVVESSLLAAKAPAVVSVIGEISISAMKQALLTARQIGAESVLNPSPYDSSVLDILNLATVLVVNQHEASAITGIPDPTSDWTGTLARFIALGSKVVIVTLGADGAMILDCSSEDPPLKVEAVKVQAVDTTGCGDAFAGALCVEIAAGKNIVDAVQFAVQVASYAATSAGAQSSYGTRKQVQGN